MSRIARRDPGPESLNGYAWRTAVNLVIVTTFIFAAWVYWARKDTALIDPAPWACLVAAMVCALSMLNELTARRVERTLRRRVAYEHHRAELATSEAQRYKQLYYSDRDAA